MRATGFSVTVLPSIHSINKVDYIIKLMIISSKSAGGPPSVDTNGSQRILASKSFKKSGSNLCEAFTTLTH